MSIFNRKIYIWNIFCVIISIAFILIGFGCNERQVDESSKSQKPNIIYILADDLGYGDLGSYGQENIRTPNLDRMAEEGMRFTNHYSGSTVCAPSRAVLMTGLHTGHAPIRGNKEIMPIGQYPLQYGTVTLPKILQEAGYTTGAFGKWGLGYPGSEGQPSLQGFDRFFGLLGQRRSHFFYPEFIFNDESGKSIERVYLEGNEVEDASTENFQREGSGPPIKRGQYSQDVMTDEALAFIEQNKETPFFLYIPSQIPHASLTVPEDELQQYLKNENTESIFDEDISYSFGAYTRTDKPAATYAAMVSRLDRYVGQILDKLEEFNLSENTIVFFTSDNGSYSEGGYHYSMHNSNAPFRGGKRDLYEGGIRVPMIAWWPGKIAPGSTSDHISYFPDMMPTFSELGGAHSPPGIDGISMVPTLLGEGNQEQHDYLYWEFHEQGGKQAIRKGKWKAIRLNVRENRDSPIELYNLNEDIAEENDISDQHPEIVEEINRLFYKEHIPSELFPLFE